MWPIKPSRHWSAIIIFLSLKCTDWWVILSSIVCFILASDHHSTCFGNKQSEVQVFASSAKFFLYLSLQCVMDWTAEPHMYTSEASAFQHIWSRTGLNNSLFTCRAFRSLNALSSMAWMALLCNINNSKLSRPDSSCSFMVVRLLYLKRRTMM